MIWWHAGQHREAPRSAGPTLCPEDHYWGIFDLTAIKEGPFLSYHVFKFICIKLSEAWIFFEVYGSSGGQRT